MKLLRSAAGLACAIVCVACGEADERASDAGTGGAGGADSGAFTLLYRDDFDTLDQARWQLMTHSWASNLALFSSQTASVENGALSIRLLPAPMGTVDDTGTPKPFLGAEVRSRDALTYGRVTARVKFARGSAVISSLVTIYTPWPADDWNEFDIECLGQSPAALQYNAQVYTGPPVTPPVTTSVSPTPDLFTDTLPFDPSEDFHVYSIEWTPAGARFVVDGEERLAWDRNIARMVRPQNVLLTIWASSSTGWAGPVTDATAQAVAAYDWVELYRYTAP